MGDEEDQAVNKKQPLPSLIYLTEHQHYPIVYVTRRRVKAVLPRALCMRFYSVPPLPTSLVVMIPIEHMLCYPPKVSTISRRMNPKSGFDRNYLAESRCHRLAARICSVLRHTVRMTAGQAGELATSLQYNPGSADCFHPVSLRPRYHAVVSRGCGVSPRYSEITESNNMLRSEDEGFKSPR